MEPESLKSRTEELSESSEVLYNDLKEFITCDLEKNVFCSIIKLTDTKEVVTAEAKHNMHFTKITALV